MSTFRTPVGPQPPQVYWRRRLVLLLGLIAVIVIIVLIVVRPGSGAPAPTPSGSNSPSPSATGSAGGLAPCDPTKVTLEPMTDAVGYDAGVIPQLSFTLKSLETEPCTVEGGSDVQEFRVTSGDELIWSSKDCQTDAVAAIVTLKPGVPLQSPAIPWDRTRSSTDTCAAAREAVVAGGASYHLEVIVGDLTSTASRQFVLY
jgi:hypothetical protein